MDAESTVEAAASRRLNSPHARGEATIAASALSHSAFCFLIPSTFSFFSSVLISLREWVWTCGWLHLALGDGGPGWSGAFTSSSGMKTSHEILLDWQQRRRRSRLGGGRAKSLTVLKATVETSFCNSWVEIKIRFSIPLVVVLHCFRVTVPNITEEQMFESTRILSANPQLKLSHYVWRYL